MKKTVAIMQPTFLPWMGYMAMAYRADLFIFLDDAQFCSSSWHSMNHIKTARGKLKVSIPVHKPRGLSSTLNECVVHPMNGERQLKKLRKTILQNYDMRGDIPLQHYHPGKSVGDANVNTIIDMGRQLGIPTDRWMRRSLIKQSHKKGFDDVMDLLKRFEATEYLAAPGTKVYMTPEKYAALESAGIALKWHDYKPVEYRQRHGEFAPYCSAQDFIYNHSPEEAEEYFSNEASND